MGIAIKINSIINKDNHLIVRPLRLKKLLTSPTSNSSNYTTREKWVGLENFKP